MNNGSKHPYTLAQLILLAILHHTCSEITGEQIAEWITTASSADNGTITRGLRDELFRRDLPVTMSVYPQTSSARSSGTFNVSGLTKGKWQFTFSVDNLAAVAASFTNFLQPQGNSFPFLQLLAALRVMIYMSYLYLGKSPCCAHSHRR